MIIDCIDAVTSFENTAKVEFKSDIVTAAKRNPILSFVNRLIYEPINIGRKAVNIIAIEAKLSCPPLIVVFLAAFKNPTSPIRPPHIA